MAQPVPHIITLDKDLRGGKEKSSFLLLNLVATKKMIMMIVLLPFHKVITGLGGKKTIRIISSLKFLLYSLWLLIRKSTEYLSYHVSEISSFCGEFYVTDSII